MIAVETLFSVFVFGLGFFKPLGDVFHECFKVLESFLEEFVDQFEVYFRVVVD